MVQTYDETTGQWNFPAGLPSPQIGETIAQYNARTSNYGAVTPVLNGSYPATNTFLPGITNLFGGGSKQLGYILLAFGAYQVFIKRRRTAMALGTLVAGAYFTGLLNQLMPKTSSGEIDLVKLALPIVSPGLATIVAFGIIPAAMRLFSSRTRRRSYSRSYSRNYYPRRSYSRSYSRRRYY